MTPSKKLIALAICLTVITACKKESSTPEETIDTTPAPTTPTINGSMSAKLNGVAWTSIKNSAALVVDAGDDLSALVINGESSADIFALGIDFPTASSTLSVGPHDLGMTQDDAVITYTKRTTGGGTVSQHIPDEGTLNITAVDNVNKKISGTFTCKMHKVGSTAAADSIYITNGVFTNITFVVQQQ